MVVLDYTVPAYNAEMVPDPDTGAMVPTCAVGTGPLRDLHSVQLFYYPASGGEWRMIREKTVAGMEGQPDTLQVNEDNGHFYILAVDTSGNKSCASNIVYHGTVTSVEEQSPLPARIVETRVYTVSGQRVHGRVASGVYLVEIHWSDGSVTTKKDVIVR